ncbi:hypothetical protein [Acinetobacter sp. ANC 4470]|uniref:hypothetical protein n=1 Tax=Acinetobacter sp. ANC 4470 TaxID=1977881 RepID=UPI001D16FCE5|nr:hypothetical protein [Acinetobacter sp. ANC 4470]
MEEMKVYFFAQALDNDSTDDWYEFTNNALLKITDEKNQSFVNNMIFELTNNGKKESIQYVDCYFKFVKNDAFDLILLINNEQFDALGRQSKTALIIQNCIRAQNSLDFEKILNLFWEETNRNLLTLSKVANQCNQMFEIVKKKNKLSWLLPLTLVSLGAILGLLFQKLSKG